MIWTRENIKDHCHDPQKIWQVGVKKCWKSFWGRFWTIFSEIVVTAQLLNIFAAFSHRKMSIQGFLFQLGLIDIFFQRKELFIYSRIFLAKKRQKLNYFIFFIKFIFAWKKWMNSPLFRKDILKFTQNSKEPKNILIKRTFYVIHFDQIWRIFFLLTWIVFFIYHLKTTISSKNFGR